MNYVIFLVSFCWPSTHPVFISQIGISAYKCKKLVPYKPVIKLTCMCTRVCVYMCVHGTQHKEEWWEGEEFLPYSWRVCMVYSQKEVIIWTWKHNILWKTWTWICVRTCVSKKHRHGNMVIHDLYDLSYNQRCYVHWFTYCNLVADAPSSAQNIIYWRKHRKSRVLFFFLLLICI